jgi:hypothetical protein
LDKINRGYLLRAQGEDNNFVEVRRPFTIDFDIQQNSNSKVKFANFKIYNIGADKRISLRLDIKSGSKRDCLFSAGYGNQSPLVFHGSVLRGWSHRQGTNWITELMCTDSFDVGASVRLQVENGTFPAGTLIKTIIESMIKSLSRIGIKRGAVGDFPGSIDRANSYTGNVIQILDKLTSGGFYISNGFAYALNDNECLLGPIKVISPASGLLGTPTREYTNIHLDVLFEPGLKMGQRVQILSTTGDADVNQVWKVNSISHRGTISEAECKSVITTVGLYLPAVKLKTVTEAIDARFIA